MMTPFRIRTTLTVDFTALAASCAIYAWLAFRASSLTP